MPRPTLQHQMLGDKPWPRLWCPPLTHYAPDGTLDPTRMAAHWAWMMPHVGGFLVPGSTGDGWDLSPAETTALLDFAVQQATAANSLLLIGALKPDVPAMLTMINDTVDRLKTRTGAADPLAAMTRSHVCGFAVCPPRGADLSDAAIEAGLSTILDEGLPIALYQLPQMTHNEVSPTTFSRLVEQYPNLIMLKDSSGTDHLAPTEANGLFLLRGAEGHYHRWLSEGGGPYHGFLLSTANSFPVPLATLIRAFEAGNIAEGTALSERITGVITTLLDELADYPHGNPFTNANKALEHYMAFGPNALDAPPPRLHAGVTLPANAIRRAGDLLREADLMPERGYLP